MKIAERAQEKPQFLIKKMSKKKILNIFKLTIVLLLSFFYFHTVNAAGCTGILQISQNVQGEHWSFPSYPITQVFETNNITQITSISLWLKAQAYTPAGICKIDIYSTNLDGTANFTDLLNSSSFNCSDITLDSWLEYSFNFDNLEVLPNTKYAMEVKDSEEDNIQLASAGYDAYADGKMWRNRTIELTDDATFEIYGCTPPPPPKMVCATSTFASAYMDLEYITGCTEHFTSSTQPDFVEYTYYHVPYLLFLYIAIVFGFVLTVMTMFFKFYGQYTKSKNRWG